MDAQKIMTEEILHHHLVPITRTHQANKAFLELSKIIDLSTDTTFDHVIVT